MEVSDPIRGLLKSTDDLLRERIATHAHIPTVPKVVLPHDPQGTLEHGGCFIHVADHERARQELSQLKDKIIPSVARVEKFHSNINNERMWKLSLSELRPGERERLESYVKECGELQIMLHASNFV